MVTRHPSTKTGSHVATAKSLAGPGHRGCRHRICGAPPKSPLFFSAGRLLLAYAVANALTGPALARALCVIVSRGCGFAPRKCGPRQQAHHFSGRFTTALSFSKQNLPVASPVGTAERGWRPVGLAEVVFFVLAWLMAVALRAVAPRATELAFAAVPPFAFPELRREAEAPPLVDLLVASRARVPPLFRVVSLGGGRHTSGDIAVARAGVWAEAKRRHENRTVGERRKQLHGSKRVFYLRKKKNPQAFSHDVTPFGGTVL